MTEQQDATKRLKRVRYKVIFQTIEDRVVADVQRGSLMSLDWTNHAYIDPAQTENTIDTAVMAVADVLRHDLFKQAGLPDDGKIIAITTREKTHEPA